MACSWDRRLPAGGPRGCAVHVWARALAHPSAGRRRFDTGWSRRWRRRRRSRRDPCAGRAQPGNRRTACASRPGTVTLRAERPAQDAVVARHRLVDAGRSRGGLAHLREVDVPRRSSGHIVAGRGAIPHYGDVPGRAAVDPRFDARLQARAVLADLDRRGPRRALRAGRGQPDRHGRPTNPGRRSRRRRRSPWGRSC